MTEFPAIKSLWNYDDPAGSEARFRELLGREGLEPDFRIEVLTQVGRTFSLRKDFAAAHAILDDVENLLKEHGGGKGEVRYLLERGRAFNSAGKAAEALPLFERAYELGGKIGAAGLAVDAAHMVAIAHPEPAEQLRWNLETIRYVEKSEDESVKGWLGPLHNNVGWTYHDRGDFVRGLSHLEKALLYHSQRGGPKQIFIARWSVGKLLRLNGRAAEALAMQKVLLADMTARGEADGFVWEELGELAIGRGDMKAAAGYFTEAYPLLGAIDWLVSSEPARVKRVGELTKME